MTTKLCLAILLILLCVPAFNKSLAHDTTQTSVQIARPDSIHADSVHLVLPTNGTFTLIWPYTQLLATLLGSFFAGLIAYFSVRVTHAKSLERDTINAQRVKRMAESKYCGLLFAIHSILENHSEMATKVESEVTAIRDRSLEAGQLIADRTTTVFPLTLFESSLLKILEFENFDTRLVGNLISYQHVLSILNATLDFSPIQRMQPQFNDLQAFLQGVKGYFEVVLRMLKRHNVSRDQMKSQIMEQLSKYPFVRIVGTPNGAP